MNENQQEVGGTIINGGKAPVAFFIEFFLFCCCARSFVTRRSRDITIVYIVCVFGVRECMRAFFWDTLFPAPKETTFTVCVCVCSYLFRRGLEFFKNTQKT